MGAPGGIQKGLHEQIEAYSSQIIPSISNTLASLGVFLPGLFLAGFWCRFGVFAPEAVPGAMDENIFQGRLAYAEGLDLSGKGLDYVGDKTMAIFNFEADLMVHDGGIDVKFVSDAVGQSLRVARFEQNDVAADFAG
jgi:hypothetical protein